MIINTGYFEKYLMIVIFSLILIFLHLGVNEFASFQFVGFLIIGASLIYGKLIDIRFWVVVCILIFIGFISVFLSDQDSRYYLVVIRFSIVVGFLSAIIFANFSSATYYKLDGIIIPVISIALMANLLLASAQMFDSIYLNGGFFDLPKEWFSIDYGTIYGDLREKLAHTNFFVRPSGFYSEPSALGALAIAGCFSGNFFRSKFILYSSLFVCVLSMSLSSFIFYFAAIIGCGYFSNGLISDLIRLRVFKFFLLFVPIIFLYIFSDRLFYVFLNEDLSSAVRVVEPIYIIGELWNRGEFFGYPRDLLIYTMSERVTTVFDNWFFNQVMLFGFFGVIYILCIFAVWPIWFFIPFFMMGVINGDPLYYDRFILLAVIFYSIRRAGFFKKE